MEWLNGNSDATWDDLLKAVNDITFGTFDDLTGEYHEDSKLPTSACALYELYQT